MESNLEEQPIKLRNEPYAPLSINDFPIGSEIGGNGDGGPKNPKKKGEKFNPNLGSIPIGFIQANEQELVLQDPSAFLTRDLHADGTVKRENIVALDRAKVQSISSLIRQEIRHCKLEEEIKERYPSFSPADLKFILSSIEGEVQARLTQIGQSSKENDDYIQRLANRVHLISCRQVENATESPEMIKNILKSPPFGQFFAKYGPKLERKFGECLYAVLSEDPKVNIRNLAITKFHEIYAELQNPAREESIETVLTRILGEKGGVMLLDAKRDGIGDERRKEEMIRKFGRERIQEATKNALPDASPIAATLLAGSIEKEIFMQRFETARGGKQEINKEIADGIKGVRTQIYGKRSLQKLLTERIEVFQLLREKITTFLQKILYLNQGKTALTIGKTPDELAAEIIKLKNPEQIGLEMEKDKFDQRIYFYLNAILPIKDSKKLLEKKLNSLAENNGFPGGIETWLSRRGTIGEIRAEADKKIFAKLLYNAIYAEISSNGDITQLGNHQLYKMVEAQYKVWQPLAEFIKQAAQIAETEKPLFTMICDACVPDEGRNDIDAEFIAYSMLNIAEQGGKNALAILQNQGLNEFLEYLVLVYKQDFQNYSDSRGRLDVRNKPTMKEVASHQISNRLPSSEGSKEARQTIPYGGRKKVNWRYISSPRDAAITTKMQQAQTDEEGDDELIFLAPEYIRTDVNAKTDIILRGGISATAIDLEGEGGKTYIDLKAEPAIDLEEEGGKTYIDLNAATAIDLAIKLGGKTSPRKAGNQSEKTQETAASTFPKKAESQTSPQKKVSSPQKPKTAGAFSRIKRFFGFENQAQA